MTSAALGLFSNPPPSPILIVERNNSIMSQNLIMTRRLNLLPIICSLFFVHLTACKDAKEKELDAFQSNLKTYFLANLMDSTATIDTFRLIVIDTITQRQLLNEQYNVLSGQLDNLIEIYKLNTKSLSLDVDQIRLYRMIESEDLVDIQRKEAKNHMDKGNLMKAEMDTLTKILSGIETKEKSADTIRPIGFEAKCFYQIRNMDKSVKRDTSFILLNINKDIVKRKDFLQLPYVVDFDKF